MTYCYYRGISCPSIDNLDIYLLPFNTLLKRHPRRVREEEALSLRVAYSLGLPVPRVISYGNDGSCGSIWMTHISGELLSQVWSNLSDAQKTTIVNEVDEC
jgi:tRNA A-37 threonylcarbamoyl transferase component Bud32